MGRLYVNHVCEQSSIRMISDVPIVRAIRNRSDCLQTFWEYPDDSSNRTENSWLNLGQILWYSLFFRSMPSFVILLCFVETLARENKEKDDKLNKLKQVAIKAKKELENYKKQVWISAQFYFTPFLSLIAYYYLIIINCVNILSSLKSVEQSQARFTLWPLRVKTHIIFPSNIIPESNIKVTIIR